MSPRDLVYVGHMLDTARKAVSKSQGISRETFEVVTDDLPKLVTALESIVPPIPPTNEH